jgi:hypothetical protein
MAGQDRGFWRQRADGRWIVRPPGCPKAILIHESKHKVTVEANGSISISPAILVMPGTFPNHPEYSWHGWLFEGRWEEI